MVFVDLTQVITFLIKCKTEKELKINFDVSDTTTDYHFVASNGSTAFYSSKNSGNNINVDYVPAADGIMVTSVKTSIGRWTSDAGFVAKPRS